MTDGIIKGTGNSRYLRTVANFLTLYPTYEAFAQALIKGTLPVDFNGINAAGWNQQGTALNKANLLADATATGMGLTAAATPNQAFAKLRSLITTAQNTANGRANIVTGSYAGTGKQGEANPSTLTFSFPPKLVIISYAKDVYASTPSYVETPLFLVNGCDYGFCAVTSSTGIFYLPSKWNGNTVSWYTLVTKSLGGYYQFNGEGTTYRYVAIG